MVFKKLAEQQGSQRGTIFLGAPEAEAEANYNSQMPLSAVYKDHCELIPSLAHEKFLIIGRKGTGKVLLLNIFVQSLRANPTCSQNS